MAEVPVNAVVPAVLVTVVTNGQVTFGYDFRADDVGDLRAEYRPSSGPSVTYIGGDDFTATDIGTPTGGEITLTTFTATVAGDTIAIYRDITIERLTDYSRDFFAADINQEQDTVFMILQEQARDLALAIQRKIGSAPFPAGSVFVSDGAGGADVGPNGAQIIAAEQYAEDAQAAAQAAQEALDQLVVPIYSTIVNLAGITVPPSVTTLRVNGRTGQGDGEGGLFVSANNGSNDTFVSGDGRTWYRSYEQQSGALVKHEGAGAVLRPLVQVLRDLGVSVSDYGAVPGAPDLETKFENAMKANRAVFVPPLHYDVTRTIQAPINAVIKGGGILQTHMRRLGNWAGPTIRIGKEDLSELAGDCEVSDMYFEQVHPGFDISTSTTMVDKQTFGQSHIECWAGYHPKFDMLWFQHGTFGISMWGTVWADISNIRSFGSWDNKNANISEQVAIIRFAEKQSVPQLRYNTCGRISRSDFGGGGPSQPRTITIGNVTYSAYENIGAQFGVLVQGCEGLDMVDSYIGGCGQSCIAFQPFGHISMVNMDGLFLDESYLANIEFLPFDGGTVNNVTLGAGMRCNSQLHTQHAIYCPPAQAGQYRVAGLSISGGQYLNMLKTPFYLLGVAGAEIAPSLVGGYNPKLSTATDYAVQAGAYVGGTSRDVHFKGGLYGGAVNDYGPVNGARWGPVVDGRPGCTAANVRAILGTPGGSVVGGISQTYPT